MAKISNPENSWDKIAKIHQEIDEDHEVSDAIQTVERTVLAAHETELEMVKGAKAILEYRAKAPNGEEHGD